MAVNLSPVFGVAGQLFDNNGNPLAGGKIFTYLAGTTTNASTYTSSNGSIAHSNPIILDSAGRVPSGEIWLTDGITYKFVVQDSVNNLIGTYDNLTGINSNFVAFTNNQEIQTATAGQTVFNLATMQYQPGTNSLSVFVDGVNQYGPGAQYAYVETDDNTVTFVSGLHVGASVKFTTSQLNSSGAVDASQVTYNPPFVGAVATNVEAKLAQMISVLDFGADPTGAVDSASAIQDAIDAADGQPVYMPTGTYRLDTGLTRVTTPSGVFGPGLTLIGDGPDKTILDFRGTSSAAISVGTTTLGKFLMWVTLEGFSITTTGSPAGAIGVQIRSVYMAWLHELWIRNMSADGVKVVMTDGDQDGSNMVTLERVRIENCGGWGINTAVTGPYNEFSFLKLHHVFIQQCGTTSATVPPPSGGIRWKGQILEAADSCVVICENVGMYIQGGAGLSNTARLTNFVFENNKSRSLYCDGLDGLTWNRGQIYNNDTFTATRGAEFNGATYSIKGIQIDGVYVRATSGNNALQAFTISGTGAALNSCRVTNTIWQNFDYAGQVRFSGWQFDVVPKTCDLVVLSSTDAVLRARTVLGDGNKMPLRLRGTGSTTGEWIQYQVSNPGISLTNAGLAANTRYYCYLWDNNNVVQLEASTSVPVLDTESGYSVKTGDATRLYVGSVETDGSANFKTSASGWLNPVFVPGSQTGVYTFMWTDSSNRLRVKYAVEPTSDTDGTIVGTQT